MTDMATYEAGTAVLTPAEARHLRALEGRIERGLMKFYEVGDSLLEIRDKRLFRLTHPSFESYARERWELDRARAYQLMGAAEVVTALGGDSAPVNEAQARELLPLYHSDAASVPEVWHAIVASGEPVTAPRIREAVRVHVTKNGTNGNGHPVRHPPPSLADRLLSDLQRAQNSFNAWKTSAPPVSERRAVKVALEEFCASAKV